MFDGQMSFLEVGESLRHESAETTPKYFLIYDELTSLLDSRANAIPVQIQVWMAKNAHPVAIVIQKGKTAARWVAVYAANYILECLLAFSDPEFMYFEYGDVAVGAVTTKAWTQVTFERFGHDCRQRLFKPYFVAQHKTRIEEILGQEVNI